MPRGQSTSVADRIQRLLNERQEHLDAVERIDSTLERISGLLDPRTGQARRGRPPGRRNKATTATATPVRRGRRRRRRRGGPTADEQIVQFVQQHRNPTTKDIKQHWKQLGRGGTADNVLSRLVKQGTLKREPLPNERGSRYKVA